MTTRRSFLKAVPAVVASAPVAATEVAAAVGLVGPVGTGAFAFANGGQNQALHGPAYPMDGGKPWFMQELESFWSDHKRDERLRQAMHTARLLDPNIASMRSISAGAAYRANVELLLKRIEADQLADYERRRDEFLSGKITGLFS